MGTLLSNRGRINLVKNDIKTLYFYLYGKIDMKYEISVSELTYPPNFSKNRKVGKSWTLAPKTKNDVITADP